MSLPHGGHLTHGTKVSFSGKWFDAVHYGVDKDTEDIDYDQVEAARPRAPPQGDPRRRLGHPAADRLRPLPGHRRRGRRDLLGRRRALHRPGRRAGDPQPGALRRRRVVHDPQGAARPALGRHRLQGRARDRHRQGRLPDDAGRPADAHDRREGRQLQGVRDARVRRVHPPGRRQRQGAGRVARREGHPPDDRRHRHAPVAARPPAGHGHRRRRRGPLRRGRHHPEQERHPVRPAEAQRRVRHPGRHAVRHDAGHGRGRDAHHRRPHRPRGRRRRRRPRARGVARGARPRSSDLVGRFPAYPRPGAARG